MDPPAVAKVVQTTKGVPSSSAGRYTVEGSSPGNAVLIGSRKSGEEVVRKWFVVSSKSVSAVALHSFAVRVEDIEADILKIKRILDSSDVVEHGIVIATIWDPNGELCKSLTRFQSENGHDKSRLFPIEISRNIDIQDHDIWKSSNR